MTDQMNHELPRPLIEHMDAPLLHPESGVEVDPLTRRLLSAVQQRTRLAAECYMRLGTHRENRCASSAAMDPFDERGDLLRKRLEDARRRETQAINDLIAYVAFGYEPGGDCSRGGAPLLDR